MRKSQVFFSTSTTHPREKELRKEEEKEKKIFFSPTTHQAREHLGDRRRVRDHAHGPLHLREVASGHDRRRLVVDAALEARRAPVDKLDRALGLDRRDGGVNVLGDDVAAVHEAAGHVLAVAGVALCCFVCVGGGWGKI